MTQSPLCIAEVLLQSAEVEMSVGQGRVDLHALFVALDRVLKPALVFQSNGVVE